MEEFLNNLNDLKRPKELIIGIVSDLSLKTCSWAWVPIGFFGSTESDRAFTWGGADFRSLQECIQCRVNCQGREGLDGSEGFANELSSHGSLVEI